MKNIKLNNIEKSDRSVAVKAKLAAFNAACKSLTFNEEAGEESEEMVQNVEPRMCVISSKYYSLNIIIFD